MSKTHPAPDDFLKWADECLAPLSTVAPGPDWEDLVPLGKMIGDASVVALCEGEHFIAEPLEFRNRVFQYLVQEKGFTAIAIESGIVEGRAVHDYVRGGSGDLCASVAAGFSWTFDRLPQNRALVHWLRKYNEDPQHSRKVNIYGFDVAGSPGNPRANRGIETALVETLKYLACVDSAAAAALHMRLDSLLPNIRFDPTDLSNGPSYCKLSRTQRDTLTAAIADLIMLMERREAHYVAASSASDYEWGYRAAIAARQVDSWLRSDPVALRPATEYARFLEVASEVRDRAQAENVDWIVRREGPSGQVLIYGHNVHLSAAPTHWTWKTLKASGNHQQEAAAIHQHHEAAGTYLRRRFGKQLVTIGHLIGKGQAGSTDCKRMLEQAPSGSIDGWAAKVDVPLFLLDLRSAPPRVRRWLERNHQLGREIEVQECEILIELTIAQAFDVLFYVDIVTPACGPADSA